MEFIIVLVALAIAYAVYKAYFAKPAVTAVIEDAPYKVEAAVIDETPAEPAPVAETAPAKKPRAPRKPAATKAKAPKAAKPKAPAKKATAKTKKVSKKV